ncbi:hypothetical protein AURDEDRAFT_184990 [Auricularia subglabra TFB-10046 SS5]|uniref:Uncharacterized protein n=1 Tax=Auricularia subglabra (strain TFB-10046 / SS5) TaxID=717982 RepID=J0WXJ5_AURST|nr:hypothetical protein AURDEDRAFT_184990 [Auricularia subglabra TFB-10046 SS5]
MTWNFTIDDTSPLVEYSPYADGDKANGWSSWWSGQGYGYSRPTKGDSPSGDSLHVSSSNGATVSLRFHGTAVSMYGRANCSYRVVLDNGQHEGKADGDLLFASDQLSLGDHYLSLETIVANPNLQQLDFDYAVVTANTPQVEQKVFNATDTSVFKYTGTGWQDADVPQVGKFRKTSVFDDTVSILLPRGTAAVMAHGSTNFGHMLYSVSLDGNVVGTYNGSSFWLVPDAMLFVRTDLDLGTAHNLTFTNAYHGGQVFSLTSVTAFTTTGTGGNSTSTGAETPSSTPPPRSTSSSNPTGAIVGGVLGAVAALSVAGILFWWWRRRQSHYRPYFSEGRTPSTYGDVSTVEAPYASSPVAWPPASTPAVDTTGARRKGKVAALALPTGAGYANPATARSTTSGPSSRVDSESISSGAPASLDINNIVELVARRIDRGPVTTSEAGAPPPEYRDEHITGR